MRRLGTVLVAFGVTGLAILLVAIVVLVVAIVPLLSAASDLERAREDAVALAGPAADALDATASSADHAGDSLNESETTARDAAGVAGQLGDAMGGLGFLSGSFTETATRAHALADDLNRTADALHQNRLDSLSAAAQLHALAGQLHDLEGQLVADGAAGPPSGIGGAGLVLVLILFDLLLVWLAAMALGAVWLGRRIRAGLLPWVTPLDTAPPLDATPPRG